MAENRQKIKLIKLYELLRKETDEEYHVRVYHIEPNPASAE